MAAKSGKPVLPDDVAYKGDNADATASKPATALMIGTIHNVAGRFDHAEIFFDRILEGQLKGASPAQLGYAAFGKAAALQGQKKVGPAKDSYLASVKAYATGSWHDETIYRVAKIIQGQAVASLSALAAKSPVSSVEIQPQSSQFLKAKLEALPYWQDLLGRYPKSDRRDAAQYNIGILLCDSGQVLQGTTLLQKLIADNPRSPYAGDACIRVIDVALERLFDLDQAKNLSLIGIDWVKQTANGEKALSDSAPTLAPWRLGARDFAAPDIKRVAYEVYLRAGIAAYLGGNYDESVAMFQAAGPEEPPTEFTSGGDLAHMGVHYLIKAANTKKAVTEEHALKDASTDQQRTALQLGDLYLEAIRPDKAEQTFLRVIDGDAVLGG